MYWEVNQRFIICLVGLWYCFQGEGEKREESRIKPRFPVGWTSSVWTNEWAREHRRKAELRKSCKIFAQRSGKCLLHSVDPTSSTVKITYLIGQIAIILDSKIKYSDSQIPAEPIPPKPKRKWPVFGVNAIGSSHEFYSFLSLPGVL